MLPCWDWLSGTLHLPRNQSPLRYGSRTKCGDKMPNSLALQLLHPFAPASHAAAVAGARLR